MTFLRLFSGVVKFFPSAAIGCCVIYLILVSPVSLALGSYQVFPVINLIAFLITMLSAAWSSSTGIAAVFFLLPFAPGMSQQISSFFPSSARLFCPELGIDLVSGFLVGSFLSGNSRYSKEMRFSRPNIITLFSLIFILICFTSMLVGIYRNFSNNGSFFSLNGLFFNFINYRSINFFDDFKPMRDLILYALSVLFLVLLAAHRFEFSSARRIVFRPFILSSVLIAFYGIGQKFFVIGYSRDPVSRGVNSFMPDLHSFGGFLVVPLFLVIWLLRNSRKNEDSSSTFYIVWLVVIALALFFSASKATIGLTLILGIGLAIKDVMNLFSGGILPQFSRFFPFFVVVFGFLVVWFGLGGYRVSTLFVDPRTLSFDKANELLSFRPEIWAAAFRIFSQYPFLGIGQGLFYRYSALADFSHSKFLSAVGGENVHNFFIQRLVENGMIGFLLFITLLFLSRFSRDEKLRAVGLVVAVSIFAGNLYAHSLLISENFLILFGLTGVCLTKIEISPTLVAKFQSRKSRFLCSIVVGGLVVMSCRELYARNLVYPFGWGDGCFRSVQTAPNPLSSSRVLLPIATGSKQLVLSLHLDHEDAGRRPVQLNFSVNQNGQRKLFDSVQLNRPGLHDVWVNLRAIDTIAGEPLVIEAQTSHCFVPKNFGLATHSGTVGFRVKSFHSSSN